MVQEFHAAFPDVVEKSYHLMRVVDLDEKKANLPEGRTKRKQWMRQRHWHVHAKVFALPHADVGLVVLVGRETKVANTVP